MVCTTNLYSVTPEVLELFHVSDPETVSSVCLTSRQGDPPDLVYHVVLIIVRVQEERVRGGVRISKEKRKKNMSIIQMYLLRLENKFLNKLNCYSNNVL